MIHALGQLEVNIRSTFASFKIQKIIQLHSTHFHSLPLPYTLCEVDLSSTRIKFQFYRKISFTKNSSNKQTQSILTFQLPYASLRPPTILHFTKQIHTKNSTLIHSHLPLILNRLFTHPALYKTTTHCSSSKKKSPYHHYAEN